MDLISSPKLPTARSILDGTKDPDLNRLFYITKYHLFFGFYSNNISANPVITTKNTEQQREESP